MTCSYCGAPASAPDPKPPASIGRQRRGKAILIPLCCAECAALAGGKSFKTRRDKCAYLDRRLRDRYLFLLFVPLTNLDVYEAPLRRWVLVAGKHQKIIQARLDHLGKAEREHIVIQCARDGCNIIIPVPRKNQKFCCPSCQVRAWQKRTGYHA